MFMGQGEETSEERKKEQNMPIKTIILKTVTTWKCIIMSEGYNCNFEK